MHLAIAFATCRYDRIRKPRINQRNCLGCFQGPEFQGLLPCNLEERCDVSATTLTLMGMDGWSPCRPSKIADAPCKSVDGDGPNQGQPAPFISRAWTLSYGIATAEGPVKPGTKEQSSACATEPHHHDQSANHPAAASSSTPTTSTSKRQRKVTRNETMSFFSDRSRTASPAACKLRH